LNTAEIEHNLSFLTDVIEGDKNEFIKNNLPLLTKLNLSGFKNSLEDKILLPKLSVNHKQYAKDKTRFIAHAGGGIDGNSYTNSLEAMDLNYKKGFRQFELDFLKTSDGKIVAVHDWEQWRGYTNYTLEGVPSYKDFMNLKILDKYTPMDIAMVNDWFALHDDAVLVTDKINNPLEFSNQYEFKNRLIMELFSWEAIKEAVHVGVRAMPSHNVVFSGSKNSNLERMLKYNIKEVALSRNALVRNQEMFLKLKNNGIKIFAYHINDNIDKDEHYVVKYEMDYYHGIYADNWSFEK